MPGKKLSPKDLELFDAQLRLLLGVLNGDMDHLKAETLGDARHVELQGDEGEGYSVEFSLELLQRDEKTAQELLDAIDRIKTGTYGRCDVCENWLLKDRLRAMPHAVRCIGCQREAEAAGA
ncbi:MAG: RNA polymerase-binding transcription factor DksA [Planctomycetota bacterium]|jgi:RNA polymerase-binding transcription factor DksA